MTAATTKIILSSAPYIAGIAVVFNSEKLELGDKVTPWSPAPEDILN